MIMLHFEFSRRLVEIQSTTQAHEKMFSFFPISVGSMISFCPGNSNSQMSVPFIQGQESISTLLTWTI